MAEAYGIPAKRRQLKNVTKDLTDVLLADLSRTEPDTYETIKACAPPERQKTWEEMDILPISAYHEVFEAYHKSGCATDGDWKSIMQQFLRCGLAFTFSGVVSTSIATDALLGVGDRVTSKVNIGALKKGYVNIAVHGHLPVLVKEIVKVGQSEKHVGECIDNARSSGVFAGIAGEFGKNLYEMPFAFSSPEWSNEKGIDATLGFRLMGITSYHCVETPIHGAPNVIKFLKEDTKETLHSSMVVDVDPVSLGEKIVADMKKKREALGI